MKIGVIADTHGNLEATRRAFTQLEKMGAELFLHLGDGTGDADEIFDRKPERLEKISGNNEDNYNYPSEKFYEWAGRRILALHGHRHNLNPYLPPDKYRKTLEKLADKARSGGAEIVLFAHTHRTEDSSINGVRLLNPGALDLGTSAKSCLLLDLSEAEPKAIFVDLPEG